jgi:hypothetical protein
MPSDMTCYHSSPFQVDEGKNFCLIPSLSYNPKGDNCVNMCYLYSSDSGSNYLVSKLAAVLTFLIENLYRIAVLAW